MKIVTVTLTLSALTLAGAALASADLAKSSGCMGCHDVSAKKMGPSFKDVAAKNKGKATAEADLVAKLNDDKKHPASKASADDKKTLVKWVLAQ